MSDAPSPNPPEPVEPIAPELGSGTPAPVGHPAVPPPQAVPPVTGGGYAPPPQNGQPFEAAVQEAVSAFGGALTSIGRAISPPPPLSQPAMPPQTSAPPQVASMPDPGTGNMQQSSGAFTAGSQMGLPEAAVRRLKEMRGTCDKPRLFTSDLSVNEFLLVKSLGFEPLGLVMGSSIYHVGFQFANNWQSMELEVLTQALYHARELAMTRMEEEAEVLGADGVVGVRLTVNLNQWGENLAEFMAIGTAVKSKPGTPYHGDHWKGSDGKPFTSELNGQDFYTLLKSGYRPVALTMGTCVYHVGAQGFRQAFQRIGRNIEMENYTQAVYDARELAISRMQAEAEREGGIGIIGSRVEEASHGWGSHTIEFLSVGTAVAELPNAGELPTPNLILPLS